MVDADELTPWKNNRWKFLKIICKNEKEVVLSYILSVILWDISFFENAKNNALGQKPFRYELRIQETTGTISRSG